MLPLLTSLLGTAVVVLSLLLVRAHRRLTAALMVAGEERNARSVVTVDVRNADEVAVRRTKLARALSAVAPRATRALVHRELVRQLRTELAGQGIDAEIRIRRLPAVPAPPTDGARPTSAGATSPVGVDTAPAGMPPVGPVTDAARDAPHTDDGA